MSGILKQFIAFFRARSPRVLSSRAGVSLAELVVAMAIMSVGILALVGSFGAIQRAVQVSKNKTLASNLAQEKMQIIKQQSYFRVLPTVNYLTLPDGTNYDITTFPPESILQGSVLYQRYTFVNVVDVTSTTFGNLPPTTPDTGVRQITVTVEWTEGGTTKSLAINSLMSNPNTIESNSVFTGTVKNSLTNAVITNAVVDVAENLGWRNQTNNSGIYTIQLSPGTYNLVASADGYFTNYSYNSVSANGTTVVNFNLLPMSTGSVTGTAWMEPNLVISQVVADTYTFAADGQQHDIEYIELFNPTTSPINLGQTGQWPWTKPYSLWFLGGDSGYSYGGYDYAMDYTYNSSNNGYSYFNFQYVSTYVPAGSYFLFANATSFMLNGTWVTADASYHPLYTTVLSTPIASGRAGQVALQIGGSWSNWADVVRWDSATSGVAGGSYWVAFTSPTIPNCCGNTSLGSPKGNQLVRVSSPSANGASMTTYGHAYRSANNQYDFLYPQTGFSSIVYMPHNVSSGSFANVAGVPAVGAIVSASDGYSNPSTATAAGWPANGAYPTAAISLTNVSTGTWTVLITSGSFELENDTVAIPTGGTVYNFPSTATILNKTATGGFISGYVTDAFGTAITAPSAIKVSPGGAGSTVNANTTNGAYLLRVSSGNIDVTANPNFANANYVSMSSLSVSVPLGTVANGVNFQLSQGGRITGWVTRDGVNGLQGVTMLATDVNGITDDQEITDVNGRFTTINLATGTYSISIPLDTTESSSPTFASATTALGTTVWSASFTVVGALGTIAGSVTLSSAPISTGVLIVVTTSTLASGPPSLSSTTLTSASYYVTSSKEDGTYSVDVRQSTSPAYNVYGYYSTINNSGTVTTTAKSVSGVQVLAGQTVSGNNLGW